MFRRILLLSVLLCALCQTVWAVPSAAPPLALTVSSTTATITNAAPNAAVLLVAELISVERGILRRDEVQELVAANAQGVAEYASPRGVPFRSVWVAIEVASGRYTVAARPEFPLEVHPLAEVLPQLSGTTIQIDTTAAVGALVVPSLETAWVAHGRDGAGSHRDGQDDGVVHLDLGSGASFGAGPADLPQDGVVAPLPAIPANPAAEEGSVFAIIDARTLAVTIGTVGA